MRNEDRSSRGSIRDPDPAETRVLQELDLILDGQREIEVV